MAVPNDPVISYSKEGGLAGSFYELKIYADGSIKYLSGYQAHREGQYDSGKIDKSELENLLTSFEDSGFLDLNSKYNSGHVNDGFTFSIRYRSNEKTKIVRTVSMFAPDVFHDMRVKLDQILMDGLRSR